MKAKKRFEVKFDDEELGYFIVDNEEDLRDKHDLSIICDLLNELDETVKDLE